MPQTDSSNNWLVLYVKRNGEKKTAERLEKAGILVYLPTLTVVRQWSDRKKKLQVPAVSGLLFVQLSVEEKNKVFDVVGPVRYLFMDGMVAQVPNHEIEAMKRYLEGKGQVDQTKYQRGAQIYLPAFEATGIISKIGAHHFWVQLPDSGLTVCLRAA